MGRLFSPLPVNGHFLPRAPAPAPPPEAQVQVCTSTSSLICLQGIWVLLGFFQPCHLPQEDEVSLEAGSPPGHQAVFPSAAAWAPSLLSGWEPLRVRDGGIPGPKDGWGGDREVFTLPPPPGCFPVPLAHFPRS